MLYQRAGDVVDRSSPTVIESACKEEFKDISEVLQSEENIGTVLNRISRTVEGEGKRSQESHEDVITCELILSYLSRSFVSVLPMRGIGPLQWTERDRVSDMRKKENYDQANANAEILRYYLDDEGEINRDEKQKIFETIVYSNVYTFETDGTIKHKRGNEEFKDIPLLNYPEGLLEAKQWAIVLANKMFKTILIEDPEKGMHHQTVRKMRDLVLRTIKGKTIISVSHNTAMVAKWTLACPERATEPFNSRSFICREINDKGVLSHVVHAFPTNFSQMAMKEEFKAILFAKRVIFVEGETDKFILEHLFDNLVLKSDSIEEKQMLTSVYIVQLSGNVKFLFDLCRQIGIKYIGIEDRDRILRIEKDTQKKNTGRIVLQCNREENPIYFNDFRLQLTNNKDFPNTVMEKEEFNSVMQPKIEEHLHPLNTEGKFIWRCGDLEDVLSEDCRGLSIELPEDPTETDPERKEKIINFPIENKKTKDLFKKTLKRLEEGEVAKLIDMLTDKCSDAESEIGKLMLFLRQQFAEH